MMADVTGRRLRTVNVTPMKSSRLPTKMNHCASVIVCLALGWTCLRHAPRLRGCKQDVAIKLNQRGGVDCPGFSEGFVDSGAGGIDSVSPSGLPGPDDRGSLRICRASRRQ